MIIWNSKNGLIVVDDMIEFYVKNVLKMLIWNNMIKWLEGWVLEMF